MHGDAVQLITATISVTITGDILSQGVLRDGRGFVELTLPDADPQQRRALEHATRFEYWLYRRGALVYQSPALTVRETRRIKDGSLVVTASP
ncbi:hypothetical protein ACGF4C_00615 [Streptomyces sp. NPDC048197]|uniref:hypothetical protein n=1 Tax=Streptomyces sp. NPDC048197 TaxID=3365511 RepID=UPI00371DE8C9